MKPDERAFEDHIADSLLERGGYREVKIGNASGDFDATRGLDLTELFAFIEETQPEAWDRLAKLHGGEAKAREQFANRLVKELDARGMVDVLRHGVVDLGVTIRLAFFKPARARPRQGQPAKSAGASHCLPVGAGVGAGCLAGPAGTVRSRREAG